MYQGNEQWNNVQYCDVCCSPGVCPNEPEVREYSINQYLNKSPPE
jgi:hypothetical protein